MGISSFFEIHLGRDMVALVTNECHTLDQARYGLNALMPTSRALQLPTPPSTPPPVDTQVAAPTQYQSPRWSKRLKLPQAVGHAIHVTTEVPANGTKIVKTAHADSTRRHAPIERVPCDILGLILSQQSPGTDQTILGPDEHVSLTLSSKPMAFKYLQTYSKHATVLDQRELLTFDRIAAPTPRRFNNPFSVIRAYEGSKVPHKTQPPQGSAESSHASNSRLKRPRSHDDHETVSEVAWTDVDARQETLDTESKSSPKRRRTDSFDSLLK